MAQARRIKRNPKRAKQSVRRGFNVPWGLLIVVAICVLVIVKLVGGARQENAAFGAGLKRLLEQTPVTETADPEITEALVNQISDKDFTFYDVLPDIEQIMPDDLPDATPTRAADNVDYFLQAASFRAHSDAETLRARLALKGYKSVTQSREVEGKGIFYRVRLDPYADKRKAKTAKNRLQRLGVRPLVYAVKKG